MNLAQAGGLMAFLAAMYADCVLGDEFFFFWESDPDEAVPDVEVPIDSFAPSDAVPLRQALLSTSSVPSFDADYDHATVAGTPPDLSGSPVSVGLPGDVS